MKQIAEGTRSQRAIYPSSKSNDSWTRCHDGTARWCLSVRTRAFVGAKRPDYGDTTLTLCDHRSMSSIRPLRCEAGDLGQRAQDNPLQAVRSVARSIMRRLEEHLLELVDGSADPWSSLRPEAGPPSFMGRTVLRPAAFARTCMTSPSAGCDTASSQCPPFKPSERPAVPFRQPRRPPGLLHLASRWRHAAIFPQAIPY